METRVFWFLLRNWRMDCTRYASNQKKEFLRWDYKCLINRLSDVDCPIASTGGACAQRKPLPFFYWVRRKSLLLWPIPTQWVKVNMVSEWVKLKYTNRDFFGGYLAGITRRCPGLKLRGLVRWFRLAMASWVTWYFWAIR